MEKEMITKVNYTPRFLQLRQYYGKFQVIIGILEVENKTNSD